jgi:serine/threonine protein kinase
VHCHVLARRNARAADRGRSKLHSRRPPTLPVTALVRLQVVTCPRKQAPQDGKDRPELAYGAKVDVWALGVLVFEIVIGRAPFHSVRIGCMIYRVALRGRSLSARSASS